MSNEQKTTFLAPKDFLRQTRMRTMKIAEGLTYTDNGRVSVNLPQSGLLHKLYLTVHAKIVVAATTITGGTWANLPNPMPQSILKRFKFSNNGSLGLQELSGWNLYRRNRDRFGLDFMTIGSTNLYSTNVKTAMGITTTPTIVPGANVAAGTFTFNQTIPINVSYNDMMETGLIVLQQNGTQYTVQLDFASITSGIGALGGTNDTFIGLVGTGITVTPTITFDLDMEWFEIPQGNIGALTSSFMNVSEQNFDLVNGKNTITPPQGDYYTMIGLQFYNNSAAVAQADILDIQHRHSGNVTNYDENIYTNNMRNIIQHRNTIPIDGCVTFDLGTRLGNVAMRDAIDAFNNNAVTGMQINATIPNTTNISGVSGINAYYETLRFAKQG